MVDASEIRDLQFADLHGVSQKCSLNGSLGMKKDTYFRACENEKMPLCEGDALFGRSIPMAAPIPAVALGMAAFRAPRQDGWEGPRLAFRMRPGACPVHRRAQPPQRTSGVNLLAG